MTVGDMKKWENELREAVLGACREVRGRARREGVDMWPIVNINVGFQQEPRLTVSDAELLRQMGIVPPEEVTV